MIAHSRCARAGPGRPISGTMACFVQVGAVSPPSRVIKGGRRWARPQPLLDEPLELLDQDAHECGFVPCGTAWVPPQRRPRPVKRRPQLVEGEDRGSGCARCRGRARPGVFFHHAICWRSSGFPSRQACGGPMLKPRDSRKRVAAAVPLREARTIWKPGGSALGRVAEIWTPTLARTVATPRAVTLMSHW